MTISSGEHLSYAVKAPKVAYQVYASGEASFAGNAIGAIFYGIILVLFFQCMVALLKPANFKREGSKGMLAVCAVAMFLSMTTYTAVTLYLQYLSCIDDPEVPRDGTLTAGPAGTEGHNPHEAIYIIPITMFQLNQWLGDGLLLYRCYLAYPGRYWVLAFPYLTYLATGAMGIIYLADIARPPPPVPQTSGCTGIGLACYLLSLSLKVMLVLMIATGLAIKLRQTQSKTEASVKASTLRDAIFAMLIESGALYTFSFTLFVVTWWIGSGPSYILRPIFTKTQIIAQFLVILRVARGDTLIDHTQGGPTNSTGTTSRQNSTISVNTCNEPTCGELRTGEVTAV